MKKFIVGFMLGAVLSFSAVGFASNQGITIFVDGSKVETDVPPQIIDGRTMVPIRFVAEALGAKVNWNEVERSVEIITETERKEEAEPKDIEVYIGETVSKGGVDLTVEGYKQEKRIGYGHYATRLYFSLINNSNEIIRNVGDFHFEISPKMYEEEFNRRSRNLNLDNSGYIYPGESAEGWIELYYEKNVTIEKISFIQREISMEPLWTWTP